MRNPLSVVLVHEVVAINLEMEFSHTLLRAIDIAVQSWDRLSSPFAQAGSKPEELQK